MRRPGYSLIEALIFMTIAVILIGGAWHVLLGGTRIGRTAVEGITLQQGVRNVVENMVRDVNGAMMIHEPNAGTPQLPWARLVLYVHQNVDPGDRVALQPGAQGPGTPYPFASTAGASQFLLPVLQVAYLSDSSANTVSRAVTKGNLVYRATGGVVEEYAFQATASSESKVLAREVQFFEVWPYAFDASQRREGGLPPLVLANQAAGSGDRIDRTLGVIVRVKANFHPDDETVKQAQDSSMEILTTILSYPKLYDTAYRSFFSSVDADLRY